MNFSDSWMRNLLWNCPYMNVTGLDWLISHWLIDQSTLVQVMAWCHQATSRYLSQCRPRSLSPYGVTRQNEFSQFINCAQYKCYLTLTTISVPVLLIYQNMLVLLSHACLNLVVLCVFSGLSCWVVRWRWRSLRSCSTTTHCCASVSSWRFQMPACDCNNTCRGITTAVSQHKYHNKYHRLSAKLQ